MALKKDIIELYSTITAENCYCRIGYFHSELKISKELDSEGVETGNVIKKYPTKIRVDIYSSKEEADNPSTNQPIKVEYISIEDLDVIDDILNKIYPKVKENDTFNECTDILEE